MGRPRKNPPKGTPEYATFQLRKKLPAGMDSTLEAMSTEELKERIVKSENEIRKVEHAKAEKTEGPRAEVRELSAPFNDAKKEQTAIIKYALHLLEAKGKITGAEDDSEDDFDGEVTDVTE